MNNINLDFIYNEAKRLGSYILVATIRDKSKTEGDLTHYLVQEDFPRDDIVSSIDSALRTMNIKNTPAAQYTQSPVLKQPGKPLKIAIITHFNRCPDSYSPGKAVKNQIKMLMQHGHQVVFFTMEGSKLDIGCEMRPKVPAFKREKNVVNEDAKQRMIDMLREELTSDFDIAITHDLYIDDCITYREAIKECGVNIPWVHWARSGVGHPINFNMPNALYVYMNYADIDRFAKNIGVTVNRVRVVFNEKDPSFFNHWNPITKMVSDKMRLWEKDVIQTFPMCTTRMAAKGLDSVLRAFSELKKLGQKVCLVVCNSNGRHRLSEIDSKMAYAKELGLDETDFCFTSTFANEEFVIHSEVPNDVVAQLMQISNLFIFPTHAEVCSNVLLEASMSKNLLVLNEDLPCLFDFADRSAVLSFPFTSNFSIHYSERTDEAYNNLAKQIIGQLKSNKSDMQFRHVWRNHNIETVYYNQLEPLIFEQLSNIK